MNQPYTPIVCGDYDYLEVACMDGYSLNIELQDGSIKGKAITTEKSAEGEFLVLELDDGTRSSVRADHIVKFVVLDKTARFREHTFTSP